MKKLIIIGAGNVGGYLAYNLSEFGSYELLGFLDDDPAKHKTTCYGYTVLGNVGHVEQLKHLDQLCVVIGISSPQARAHIAKSLQEFDLNFPNFIAENAWLSKSVILGKGVILYPGVSINYETSVGDFVLMNMNCAIGHNCNIQNYSTLAPGVNLGGFTTLEQEVNIGIGVSTRQNIRIGARASVGGQSMVVKDVESGALVMGVPAKRM